jgi:hypothetical protein
VRACLIPEKYVGVGASVLDRPRWIVGISEETDMTTLRSDRDLSGPLAALRVPRNGAVLVRTLVLAN